MLYVSDILQTAPSGEYTNIPPVCLQLPGVFSGKIQCELTGNGGSQGIADRGRKRSVCTRSVGIRFGLLQYLMHCGQAIFLFGIPGPDFNDIAPFQIRIATLLQDFDLG